MDQSNISSIDSGLRKQTTVLLKRPRANCKLCLRIYLNQINQNCFHFLELDQIN